MGGAVSTGRNNDDLVDNLVSADYIRTPTVQKLFRAVNRADYFLPNCRKNAYKDLAWKSGNLHLSAPCIYSEVMEGLCLKQNLSFLNLGSGTGYLSTMVGLAIGSGGINHGVELFPDVIEYAIRKLEEFKRYSSAIDEYDLCEPKFVQGNCLCLSSDTLQYDRVYCGGACPLAHMNYMKNLIKVGGILVMPVEDQLIQIERTSETAWVERSLLPVSFATLILPEEGSLEFVELLDVEPSSLEEMCRTVIRKVLRTNIDREFPNLKLLPKRKRMSKRQRSLQQTMLSQLDTSDDESEGEDKNVGKEKCEVENTSHHSRSIGAFIDIVLGRFPEHHTIFSSHNSASLDELNSLSNNIETDRTENQENSNTDSKPDTNPQQIDIDKSNLIPEDIKSNLIPEDIPMSDASTSTNTEQASQTSRTAQAAGNGTVIARILIRKRTRVDGIEEDNEGSEEECSKENVTEAAPAKSKTEVPTAAKSKREKFDSGLGDDIVVTSSEGESTHQEEDRKKQMDTDDPSSSSDEDYTKESVEASVQTLRGRHWRTVNVPSYAVDHLLGHVEDETPEEESETTTIPPQPVVGPYTIHMRNKIKELPLPKTLKNYLNYYKEF